MNLLAFDTSSSACSVALQKGDQIEFRHQIAPMQQAQLILPRIKEVLDALALTINDLDCIAYGNGPGSFTGVRIANTVAQGLGFAANLPLIQISSLAALAQTAYIEQKYLHCLVALDARVEQIYWAEYRVNQEGLAELIGEEQLCTPNEAKIEKNLVDTKWCAIGDGWEKYATTLMDLDVRPQHMNTSLLPTALAVLQLAKSKFEKGEWVTAASAVPAYLR